MESGWGRKKYSGQRDLLHRTSPVQGTGRSQADQVYSGSRGSRDGQAPGHEVFLDHCFSNSSRDINLVSYNQQFLM